MKKKGKRGTESGKLIRLSHVVYVSDCMIFYGLKKGKSDEGAGVVRAWRRIKIIPKDTKATSGIRQIICASGSSHQTQVRERFTAL